MLFGRSTGCLTPDIAVFFVPPAQQRAKARENPLTGVTLLDRNVPVIFKNFPDDRNERLDLGFFT